MVYSFSIMLLALGALQGGLLSIFLFRRKAKDPSRVYFALFLVVVGLQLTFKAITKAWLWHNVQFVYLLSYSLPFLIGPLLFLFVRAKGQSIGFRWRDAVHFIPFVINISRTASFEMFAVDIFPLWPGRLIHSPGLELLSLGAYGFAAWKLSASPGKASFEKGIREFLIWVVSVESIILITIAFMIRNIETFPDIRMLFVALTVLIYWISYKLISDPQLFTAMGDGAVFPLVAKSTIKYSHSGLQAEEADRIAALLREAMNGRRIFLEADISLDAVSGRLGISKHHLSRVINERFGKTYVELANGWRLEEACARLSDPRFSHRAISTIALDAGFSSVSSFNTMFKKRFRMTPSEFRRQGSREMSA